MAFLRVDAYKTLAYTSITTSFVAVGSPIGHNYNIIRLVNNTDGDMIISFDGTTLNTFLPAGSFLLLDLSTNAPPIQVNDSLVIQKNTQIYVKYSSAPSKGAVFVEGYYENGG